MEDWDDNIPNLLKKEQLKNKWDDEDLEDDDVKDSWEDDDKPDVAPKAEPTPEKVPKKAAGKLDEKKGKVVEKVVETAKESLDPIEEKFHRQRLVEKADYKSIAELFAEKGTRIYPRRCNSRNIQCKKQDRLELICMSSM